MAVIDWVHRSHISPEPLRKAISQVQSTV